jgi:hypothetical protein
MATETLPQTTISVEFLPDGQTPVISSRDVALHFQKKHKDILRDIDRIKSMSPKEFTERNFALCYYSNELSNDKPYPYYRLTRLKRASSARLKSARHTCGKGFSCWPTPTVEQSGTWPDLCLVNGSLTLMDGEHQMGIHMAAKTWTLLYMMGMGKARACSLPIRVTLRPGKAGSPHGLTCNPLWLEAMMGWPAKWTDTGSRVTGFARWRRRMRSALCCFMRRD